MSNTHILNLLRGKSRFIMKTACLFSDVFGLSPAWLMTGEGSIIGESANGTSGSRLKTFMESRRLRPTDLCKLSGISSGVLSQVLHETQNLSPNYAERLSSALGVSAGWLLTGEGPMEVEGWTPPEGQPVAVSAKERRASSRDTGEGVAELRRENEELRAEVARLRGQEERLLTVIQNLSGGRRPE